MAAEGLTHGPLESLFFSGTAFAAYPRFDAILPQGPIAIIGAAPGVVVIGFITMWSVLSSSLCALALMITNLLFVDDEVELPRDQPRLEQTTPPSHPVVAAR